MALLNKNTSSYYPQKSGCHGFLCRDGGCYTIMDDFMEKPAAHFETRFANYYPVYDMASPKKEDKAMSFIAYECALNSDSVYGRCAGLTQFAPHDWGAAC